MAAYTTYGTGRANAYKILEDSLNLRDVRIYDTVEDADGKERRVLNAKETTLPPRSSRPSGRRSRTGLAGPGAAAGAGAPVQRGNERHPPPRV